MHTNVYPSGKVCLSTIGEVRGQRCGAWHPSFTVAEILLSVQLLLNDPNNNDPAQEFAYHLHKSARAVYDERVRAQAARYTAAAFEDLVNRHCIPAPRVVEGWTADGQHRIVRGQGG